MRFTYPISLAKSRVARKYDMVAVDFPTGRKLFGTCPHGMNGAMCDACKGTGRFHWIDRDKLGSLPTCRWCGERIIHFAPTPYRQLARTRDRQIKVYGPDITHDGDRGCWYLKMPLHYGCLIDGEGTFHTFGDDVNRPGTEVPKEADRSYYPEVRDVLGEPEADEEGPSVTEVPFGEDGTPVTAPQFWNVPVLDERTNLDRELERFSAMCGTVAHSTLIPRIKCGQCKNKHQTAYQVRRCYENANLSKEKEG